MKINEEIVFPEDVALSRECKEFVMLLLERDPKMRCEIELLLNHAFIKGVKQTPPL